MATDSSRKYSKETLREFKLRLNRNTQPDMIKWLEQQPNKRAYICNLIAEDMKKNNPG